MPRVLLEIAVDSLESARAAIAAGAERLEMCSRLDVGGLTPDPAWVRAGAAAGWHMAAMIRPRGGAFTATPAQLAHMERDIDAMLAAGARGMVFGLLHPDATLDAAACMRLVRRARASDPAVACVFHRAFDELPDPAAALNQLVDLGFTRVLTTGGRTGSAADPANLARLAALQHHARGRIEILPGGGVRSANAAAIIRATGCTQIHSSGRTAAGVFDPAEVAALADACANTSSS